MGAYWATLLDVTIPILLAVFAGGLLGRLRPVNTQSVADVAMYILAPALVLHALVGGDTGRDALDVAAFTLVDLAGLWILTALTGRILRFTKAQRAGLMLTTLFSNAVNYGLPVCLLAFGQTGYRQAALYVVGQSFLLFSLGVYLASAGTRGPGAALAEVRKTPVIYAAVAAAALAAWGVHWPGGIDSALGMLADAYPALALMVLGLQLARTDWRQGLRSTPLWVGILLRLIAAPLIAKGALWVLGIHGTLASVLFVEASMPAPVNAAVFVEQFGGERSQVAMTVAITTAVSFLILPWLVNAS
ncbi:AEC family transporter [Alicyclobacillus sp.]|uniref:AEC family transporter n=1 Tax=Alicyclobacillus sp. TaxID=61169 RepID=UPI0025BDCB5D|nr:AEC family transporter [Alicyclobacillus sp.]MCL6515458.1 AEC family transporter [Alicyclobacillus sp.]